MNFDFQRPIGIEIDILERKETQNIRVVVHFTPFVSQTLSLFKILDEYLRFQVVNRWFYVTQMFQNGLYIQFLQYRSEKGIPILMKMGQMWK